MQNHTPQTRMRRITVPRIKKKQEFWKKTQDFRQKLGITRKVKMLESSNWSFGPNSYELTSTFKKVPVRVVPLH